MLETHPLAQSRNPAPRGSLSGVLSTVPAPPRVGDRTGAPGTHFDPGWGHVD